MAEKSAKKATKKTAPKPKKAAAKSPSKASLVKKMRDAGLSVPEGADVAMLQHRLKHYKGADNEGYNVSLFRGWGSQYENHPISLLSDRKAMYWLPASEMAEQIVRTKMVKVMKRGLPLNNAVVIDVPIDYEARFNGGDK
tara:strand:+ start:257 stop:676 length:420 start_codon:yes stop_codon:yes gene_type:complete